MSSILFRAQMNTIPFCHLSSKFSGTCIIAGSGPSLLNLPKDCQVFTIAINYAFLHIPNSISFFSDIQYACENTVKHHSSRYQRLYLSGCQEKRIKHSLPGFQISSNQYEIENIKTNTIMSGYRACLAAHLMGFSKLILVGFDATPGSAYQYARYHPLKGYRNRKIESNPNQIINHYHELKNNASRLGIINCSNSDFAQKENLSQVLADLPANKEGISNEIRKIYLENISQSQREEFLSKLPL